MNNLSLELQSYGDMPSEKVFKLFFPSEDYFPSVYGINQIGTEIIPFLYKNFEYICCNKFTSLENESQQEDGFGQIFNSASSESNVLFFKVKNEKEPILIRLISNNETFHLTIIGKNTTKIEKLQKQLSEKFVSLNDYGKKTYFGLLYKDDYGIKIKKFPLSDQYLNNLDLALNYGDDFVKINEIIISKIKNNKSGIITFRSDPGVGKTSYIKYLSKQMGKERTFIYVPSNYIEALSSPDLIPLLIKWPNSIVILEDAESAIISRENKSGNESIVSNLLNLGDGILGSVLNIIFIITYNTSKANIDKALVRKKRLLYEYEFKKLSIENSKRLLRKLGKNNEIKEPMTLAEIYGIDDYNGHIPEVKDEKRIGFY